MMESFYRIVYIPDKGIWDVLERALRDRIGLAHHSACAAHGDPNASEQKRRVLDREYEDAVQTYEIITGKDLIAPNRDGRVSGQWDSFYLEVMP